MNIKQIAAAHGVTVEAARAIVEAAVSHAERRLDLEYNSPAGRMKSEESERAIWLVRDFAMAGTLAEEIAELQDFDPCEDYRKDWRDE